MSRAIRNKPDGTKLLGLLEAPEEWAPLRCSLQSYKEETNNSSQAPLWIEALGGVPSPGPFFNVEEEKLKFYIISFSFCFCNSACPLQSLDHIGHVVSESGDLQY